MFVSTETHKLAICLPRCHFSLKGDELILSSASQLVAFSVTWSRTRTFSDFTISHRVLVVGHISYDDLESNPNLSIG